MDEDCVYAFVLGQRGIASLTEQHTVRLASIFPDSIYFYAKLEPSDNTDTTANLWGLDYHGIFNYASLGEVPIITSILWNPDNPAFCAELSPVEV